jgi:hypothetical protein
MEALTRLVTESLARHGFDRPLDYRRLHWSQWFRCESHHSLLAVPSKPGVFAIAEEITEFGTSHVGTAALDCPAGQSSAAHSYPANEVVNRQNAGATVEERRFSAASSAPKDASSAPVGIAGGTPTIPLPRRLLAVTQFFESDDMAFSLDRMLVQANPMRARLNSGRYFIRYVTIGDESQRRSIATALNQWIANTKENSGIGSHFASSLELSEARVDACDSPAQTERSSAAPHLDSGAATNIHCPSPLPSGF